MTGKIEGSRDIKGLPLSQAQQKKPKPIPFFLYKILLSHSYKRHTSPLLWFCCSQKVSCIGEPDLINVSSTYLAMRCKVNKRTVTARRIAL